jgi:hypothetical protein
MRTPSAARYLIGYRLPCCGSLLYSHAASGAMRYHGLGTNVDYHGAFYAYQNAALLVLSLAHTGGYED